MNTDLLRYFVALAEARHLQTAADRLHLSPQALSKALATLEKHYGAPLLARDHKIRGLTRAGEALLAAARGVLAAEEDCERRVAEAEGPVPRGPVAIGGDGLWHHHLMPRAIARVLAAHPEVRPALHEMLQPEIERHVAEGALDLGLLLAAPQRPDLEWREGLATPYVIAGHPARRGAAWEALGYVAPRVFGRAALAPLDGWDEARFPRRIVATVELLETALRLVEADVGVAFVPRLAVEAHLADGRLAIVAEAPLAFEDRLFVVWRRGVTPTPAAAALREALFAIGQGSGA